MQQQEPNLSVPESTTAPAESPDRHAWREKAQRMVYIPKERALPQAPSGFGSTFRNSAGRTYVRPALGKGSARRVDLIEAPGLNRREKKRLLREQRIRQGS